MRSWTMLRSPPESREHGAMAEGVRRVERPAGTKRMLSSFMPHQRIDPDGPHRDRGASGHMVAALGTLVLGLLIWLAGAFVRRREPMVPAPRTVRYLWGRTAGRGVRANVSAVVGRARSHELRCAKRIIEEPRLCLGPGWSRPRSFPGVTVTVPRVAAPVIFNGGRARRRRPTSSPGSSEDLADVVLREELRR